MVVASFSAERAQVPRPAICQPRQWRVGSSQLEAWDLYGEGEALVEEVARRWPALAAGNPEAEAALAGRVPLTAALALHHADGRATVIRGAACPFGLYRRAVRGGLRLATALPGPADAPLSISGTWRCLAHGLLQGAYEPNLVLETPFAEWRRLRRGAISYFDPDGALRAERPIRWRPAQTDRIALAECIAAALKAFSAARCARRTVLLEVSGGYDSTLAGLAARPHAAAVHGVAIDHPWYEFRHEPPAQRAAAAAVSIGEPVWLDGREMLPYAPASWLPRTPEPCLGITGLERTRRVLAVARDVGAQTILVGTGGDQLFGTDLCRPEPLGVDLPRGLLSRHGLRAHDAALQALRRETTWLDRGLGTFIDPACFYVQAGRDAGVSFASPFAQSSMLRSALCWSALKQAAGRRAADKEILQDLPGLSLPPEITGRPGKVPYDGAWCRAAAKHGDAVAATLEEAATIFDRLGFDLRRLLRQLQSLMAWRSDRHQEVIMAYAWAAWFRQWGVDSSRQLVWHD